jgi:hypothetical protein
MAKKIMIIRHGEKPDKKQAVKGVSQAGSKDKQELSTRGWQRSGALVRFFNPVKGATCPHPALARPDMILAEDPKGHIKSERPLHTVSALAESLRKKVVRRYTKGQEQALVKFVTAQPGVVLISWEHKAIIDIANLLLGDNRSCPQEWRGKRFDLVWIFDRKKSGWKLTQVPQLLLPGDSPRLLK